VPPQRQERYEKVNVNTILKEYSRQLRHNQTKAEAHLWYYLRAGRLADYKFKRQYVIENFIVDFYCAKTKTAIEIDGDEHYTKEHQEYDETRSKVLNSKRINILRYTNREVICKTDNVLSDIFEALSKH